MKSDILAQGPAPMQGVMFMALFYLLSLALYVAIVILGCTRERGDEHAGHPAGKAAKYPVVENKYGADVCPICLEDFDEESYCRILECSHVFHYECVNEWFSNVAVSCPLCQQYSE